MFLEWIKSVFGKKAVEVTVSIQGVVMSRFVLKALEFIVIKYFYVRCIAMLPLMWQIIIFRYYLLYGLLNWSFGDN
jgi:hypothetical protein